MRHDHSPVPGFRYSPVGYRQSSRSRSARETNAAFARWETSVGTRLVWIALARRCRRQQRVRSRFRQEIQKPPDGFSLTHHAQAAADPEMVASGKERPQASSHVLFGCSRRFMRLCQAQGPVSSNVRLWTSDSFSGSYPLGRIPDCAYGWCATPLRAALGRVLVAVHVVGIAFGCCRGRPTAMTTEDRAGETKRTVK